ncbi:MAG TPA: hypothetical protein VFE41_32745 [Acetobacteraceae bacterium]|jgi:hypothetical protein|nr:hypothetical protein [Acetobacteraceae bacterium]
MRMTDREAEAAFAGIRWTATDGKPVCPRCDCPTARECREANGAQLWRGKACGKCFSVTSGTLLVFHKLPIRAYLGPIAIFCDEVKGEPALVRSRDLGTQYNTAFILAHKLREAMASELKGTTVGEPEKVVETDGGYFRGYVKHANHNENRRDHRLAKNQNGKRQVILMVREREG